MGEALTRRGSELMEDLLDSDDLQSTIHKLSRSAQEQGKRPARVFAKLALEMGEELEASIRDGDHDLAGLDPNVIAFLKSRDRKKDLNRLYIDGKRKGMGTQVVIHLVESLAIQLRTSQEQHQATADDNVQAVRKERTDKPAQIEAHMEKISARFDQLSVGTSRFLCSILNRHLTTGDDPFGNDRISQQFQDFLRQKDSLSKEDRRALWLAIEFSKGHWPAGDTFRALAQRIIDQNRARNARLVGKASPRRAPRRFQKTSRKPAEQQTESLISSAEADRAFQAPDTPGSLEGAGEKVWDQFTDGNLKAALESLSSEERAEILHMSQLILEEAPIMTIEQGKPVTVKRGSPEDRAFIRPGESWGLGYRSYDVRASATATQLLERCQTELRTTRLNDDLKKCIAIDDHINGFNSVTLFPGPPSANGGSYTIMKVRLHTAAGNTYDPRGSYLTPVLVFGPHSRLLKELRAGENLHLLPFAIQLASVTANPKALPFFDIRYGGSRSKRMVLFDVPRYSFIDIPDTDHPHDDVYRFSTSSSKKLKIETVGMRKISNGDVSDFDTQLV